MPRDKRVAKRKRKKKSAELRCWKCRSIAATIRFDEWDNTGVWIVTKSTDEFFLNYIRSRGESGWRTIAGWNSPTSAQLSNYANNVTTRLIDSNFTRIEADETARNSANVFTSVERKLHFLANSKVRCCEFLLIESFDLQKEYAATIGGVSRGKTVKSDESARLLRFVQVSFRYCTRVRICARNYKIFERITIYLPGLT